MTSSPSSPQSSSTAPDWQQHWQTLKGLILCGPLVGFVVLALRATAILQPLEWMCLDQFFLLRPAESKDERITLVGLDERDIEQYGTPISDATLADLLETLLRYQPNSIGIDFYRNIPEPPGEARLAKIFKDGPDNIFGIAKIVPDQNGDAIPPPKALADRGLIGVNDISLDADGRIRRGLLFLNDPNNPDGADLPSLGFQLAWHYLYEHPDIDPSEQNHPSGFLQLGQQVFYPLQPGFGSYVRADTSGYQVLLNYRGKTGSFDHLSVRQVLAKEFDPELIRDRIILIGPFAPSLNDTFPTPYSSNIFSSLILEPEQMPGVEVQAHLASQIISAGLDNRPLVRSWADWGEAIWIISWSSLAAFVYWRLRFHHWSFAVMLGLGVAATGTAFLLFLQSWWIPVAPVLIGIGGSYIAMTSYIARTERQDRQLMMHLFGRHVTPQVAEEIWRQRERILKEGRLIGQRTIATVLFTDIKNFSTIAENLDPEVLMEWLNQYMEGMAEVVLEHGGVIDKFIGDAVMAVFGVPILRETEAEIAQDAIAAVQCAVAMGNKLSALNEEWKRHGKPMISMRVGIATGPLVVGSLGSAQREDYTIIGDSVNVAARLESYEKSIEGGICRILIGETTYQYIQGKFSTKMLGSALLKGRGKPVNIFQVETLPDTPNQPAIVPPPNSP